MHDQSSIPPGSRVWGYTRDSGGDEQSVGDQNRYVERYCKERGVFLEHMFCDEARPGSSVAGRDQFQAMVDLVRRLPEDRLPVAIIFWSLARCARDFDDAQFYKADIRRRGIVIDSITDDIPMDSPHGRLIEAIIDWKNAQFLRDLSKNVKRGLQDLARRGYSSGGFPPAGYMAERVTIGTKHTGEPRVVSKWVLDPVKAPLVRKAWEMRVDGASYKEIHEATGIFGATNSYACMFRNRTYLGIRKCGDLEVEGAHEAIITPAMWEAVQATLQKRGERLPRGQQPSRSKRSPFLLSGFAFCLYCGAAMSGGHSNVNNRPNPWAYYLCGRKRRHGWHSCEGRMVNARVVEQVTLAAVLNRILTPDFVEQLVENVNRWLNEDTDGLDVRIERAGKRLGEVERAIANLLDLTERTGSQAALGRMAEREAEMARLAHELESLKLRKRQSRLEASTEVVLDTIASARESLGSEDVKAKRTLLRKFVDKVEIGREGGKLWYTFPLTEVVPELTLHCFEPPWGHLP